VTKDKELGKMVSKMLSNNVFDVPNMDKIANMMQAKASIITPKKRMHTNNLEI
jgi:hypothetical protein